MDSFLFEHNGENLTVTGATTKNGFTYHCNGYTIESEKKMTTTEIIQRFEKMKRFIYTLVSSDWKFGKECSVIGALGNGYECICGKRKFFLTKEVFDAMPNMSEKEIATAREKAVRKRNAAR